MLCQDGRQIFGQIAAFCVIHVYILVCMMCVYVCVWLSAKMAHLLACSVKMAYIWTEGCILCCMHVYLYSCVCLCLCLDERLGGTSFSVLSQDGTSLDGQLHLVLYMCTIYVQALRIKQIAIWHSSFLFLFFLLSLFSIVGLPLGYILVCLCG